jgi:hypothetical protein
VVPATLSQNPAASSIYNTVTKVLSADDSFTPGATPTLVAGLSSITLAAGVYDMELQLLSVFDPGFVFQPGATAARFLLDTVEAPTTAYAKSIGAVTTTAASYDMVSNAPQVLSEDTPAGYSATSNHTLVHGLLELPIASIVGVKIYTEVPSGPHPGLVVQEGSYIVFTKVA